MTCRNLTDVYILMRNNAITSKNVFNDQSTDDRAALVLNLENAHFENKTYLKSPPEWANNVDQIQYELTKIKNKIKELSTLHDRHLTRPTLDDNTNEEKVIDVITQEITKMINQSQLRIKQISNWKNKVPYTEQRLITNVVNSLAKSLQDITFNFRKAQSTYLNRIKSREEISKMPFDSSKFDALMMEQLDRDESNERNAFDTFGQTQMLKEHSEVLNVREKEITHIVKSIQDLNDIFKDLATMIVDQGTVLDRIDYNIEKTSIHVKQGLENLQKASKYQKKNRKMYFIFILAAVVVFLFVLLIIVKT